MRIYVLVMNGLVVNRAVFDEAGMPKDWGSDAEGTWIEDDQAQIGWLHGAYGFVPPPVDEPGDAPSVRT